MTMIPLLHQRREQVKRNQPLHQRVASVESEPAHAMIGGDHHLVSVLDPFRQENRQQVIIPFHSPVIVPGIVITSMPCIVDIHGMDQQKIWVSRNAQVFPIEINMAIRIAIFHVINPLLDLAVILQLEPVGGRMEGGSSIKFTDPVVGSGSSLQPLSSA